MDTSRADGYLTTTESAKMLGVSRETIRAWRKRPRDPMQPGGPYVLEPEGLDERGWPLYSRSGLREAERFVRERGLELGGYDPRRLRGPAWRARRDRTPASALYPLLLRL